MTLTHAIVTLHAAARIAYGRHAWNAVVQYVNSSATPVPIAETVWIVMTV
jgi:hypothetical protein